MAARTPLTIPSRPKALCRIIDGLLVITVLALIFLPLLMLCCYRLLKGEQALERIHLVGANYRPMSVLRVRGDGLLPAMSELLWVPCGGLALLGGPLQYQGMRYGQYRAWPGVIALEDVLRRMGLGYQDDSTELKRLHASATAYLMGLGRALLCLLLVPRVHPGMRRVSLFGIGIDNLSMPGLISQIAIKAGARVNSNNKFTDKARATAKPEHYAFINTDCLNIAAKDTEYRALLGNCDGVFADGMGVRLACHLTGQGLRDNLNGTDLFPLLCQRLAQEGLGLFLLGGAPGVADAAAKKMQQQYPSLTVSGVHHGFVESDDWPKVIEQINQSGAAVLLVGMGAPLQERWIASFAKQLNVGVALGVGGLFDFYSGRIPRAPQWLRQLGFEWVWRLMQEPARMWRRYLIGNPLFLLRVLAERRRLQQAPKQQPPLPQLGWQAGKVQSHRPHQLRLLCGRIGKRSLDILVSSLALLLLTPLFLLVALAIRLESPGAVLYSQTRAGAGNRPFTMWKFRSMYLDAEARHAALQNNNEMSGGVLFKMRRDPRITLVGRFIRKASIDELPQLWNVLKGDMSLVGPRPALPREVEQYPANARQRLAVKPGITCIWQVSGRSDIPFDTQVELDLEYIHTQSLWADVCLLAKTIPAVLTARGAY